MGQFGHETQGLKVIKVKKSELINLIKNNKIIHGKEYKEAYLGFFEKAKDDLVAALGKIQDGKIPDSIHFNVPSDHSVDYQDTIDMLHFSVDDEVEITYEQYKRYVKDEWNWTQNFKHLHTLYNN